MPIKASWGKPPLETITVTGKDTEQLVEICEMARRFCDKFRETREGVYFVREWGGPQLAQIEDLMGRIFRSAEGP